MSVSRYQCSNMCAPNCQWNKVQKTSEWRNTNSNSSWVIPADTQRRQAGRRDKSAADKWTEDVQVCKTERSVATGIKARQQTVFYSTSTHMHKREGADKIKILSRNHTTHSSPHKGSQTTTKSYSSFCAALLEHTMFLSSSSSSGLRLC